MALICCPECGKEISDKANTCPSCGLPLKSANEEYLCCPRCLSKELHAEHKGYSGKNALVGGLLIGGVGLLAGTIGSTDVLISCLKCGAKFKAGEALTVNTKKDNSILDEALLSLLKEGKTLEAVKYHKDVNNCGLSESKNYVDRLRGENKDIIPANSGCLVMFFAVIAICSFCFCCIRFKMFS